MVNETKSKPQGSPAREGGASALSSLRLKVTAHMVVTLLILSSLGVLMVAAYWRDYSKLLQSRQYARLAVLFAEIGEFAQTETNRGMFDLLFAPAQPVKGGAEAQLAQFQDAVRETDSRLQHAAEYWASMDRSGADAITLARIEEGFRKAQKLEACRKAVLSLAQAVPDEIERSEAFVSRVSHHRELGMTPERARSQALWDIIKDGTYADLVEYSGTMLLYLSRVTPDAEIARDINLHSELLRYHMFVARENNLIAYFLSKGARPHGLLSDDIGWLRSLWDRESMGYLNIWSLAQESVRPRIQSQLSLDSYPRVSSVRRWLAANWTNNDMSNWKDLDVSQASTPELLQDLDYTREFNALQLMRSLRHEMLATADSRLHQARNAMVIGIVILLCGCALVLTGFWWVKRLVIERVWNLASQVRQVQETGDVSLRIFTGAHDEVGELERAFNGMLEAVESNRRGLEAARSMLESRVLERTAEVNQRLGQVEKLNGELNSALVDLRTSRDQSETYASRLSESNQQLVTANQELESFVYSASHDLRTPLRNIVGFIELLRLHSADKLDKEAMHRLGVVLSEAKRLSALIDGLLAFFRVGRSEMRLEPVYIGLLVEELRSEFAPRTAGRRIVWRVGDMPACTGDPELLRQLLEILIDNAIKFTSRKEEAVIDIGYIGGGGRPDEMVYYVRDNGTGFNPQYGDKLFRVFQRLHSPKEFEGNGIGLANMKRIVSRHGGRVWAEGSPGLGACFYFALPLKPPRPPLLLAHPHA